MTDTKAKNPIRALRQIIYVVSNCKIANEELTLAQESLNVYMAMLSLL